MIALKELKACRHDLHQNVEVLCGRTVKVDPSRRGLHSQRNKLGRCVITSTGPRHVVLAAAYTTRALAPGRVDIGLAGLHRSFRLQTERSGSKICHSSPLSTRLAPRLVVTHHALTEPAMASTASSLGKTSSVKVKRYSHLPLLATSTMVSRSAEVFSLPLPPTASASLRQIAPPRHRPFVNREVQLRGVVFDCA